MWRRGAWQRYVRSTAATVKARGQQLRVGELAMYVTSDETRARYATHADLTKACGRSKYFTYVVFAAAIGAAYATLGQGDEDTRKYILYGSMGVGAAALAGSYLFGGRQCVEASAMRLQDDREKVYAHAGSERAAELARLVEDFNAKRGGGSAGTSEPPDATPSRP